MENLNVNPGAETGAIENPQPNQGEQTTEGIKETAEKTYTEKELQAETDRRVNQAQKTWESKLPDLIKSVQDEAKRLEAMSAEQRLQHELKTKQEAIETKEKELKAKELQFAAKSILSEKGLPSDWSEFLPTDSAEKCNEAIEALEKAFNIAIENAVEKKLKSGGIPKAVQNTQPQSFDARLAEARKSGNNRQVIAIKQEAAAQGIILN